MGTGPSRSRSSSRRASVGNIRVRSRPSSFIFSRRGPGSKNAGIARIGSPDRLAPGFALWVAVFEVLLPGTWPGDDLEGRVGNVVADVAADRDLGTPVDLHVLDEVLVLLGQELGQRLRRLVEMVVRVKERKRDVFPMRQLPHEILL